MFYYTNIVIFSSFGISNSSSQNGRKLYPKRLSFGILIMFLYVYLHKYPYKSIKLDRFWVVSNRNIPNKSNQWL